MDNHSNLCNDFSIKTVQAIHISVDVHCLQGTLRKHYTSNAAKYI